MPDPETKSGEVMLHSESRNYSSRAQSGVFSTQNQGLADLFSEYVQWGRGRC